MPDLWGNLPGPLDIQTPNTILQEQANLLRQKTNGLLVGEVVRRTTEDAFRSTLRIIAPSLNNYRYSILTVEYPISLYPLSVINHVEGMRVAIPGDQQFIGYLGNLLSSQKVSRVIGGLLSQIRADSQEET